jgi:hypothetical protein
MPFARLFPFGVIKQQGSGASFSEISSHALLGCRLLTLLGGEGCGGGEGGGRRLSQSCKRPLAASGARPLFPGVIFAAGSAAPALAAKAETAALRPSMRYSVGLGLGPRCNSWYIRTCCDMAAAMPWPTRATTHGRCRPGSGTRTSSTRCAIPSWPPIGSRISGDESRPPSAVDGGPVRVRQAAAQQGTSSCGSWPEARSQRSSCAFIGLAYRP